jgi:hypothetical protein
VSPIGQFSNLDLDIIKDLSITERHLFSNRQYQ